MTEERERGITVREREDCMTIQMTQNYTLQLAKWQVTNLMLRVFSMMHTLKRKASSVGSKCMPSGGKTVRVVKCAVVYYLGDVDC